MEAVRAQQYIAALHGLHQFGIKRPSGIRVGLGVRADYHAAGISDRVAAGRVRTEINEMRHLFHACASLVTS